MRISVNKNDPGYTPRAFGCKVYVDGAFVERCVTADTDEGGVAIRYPQRDGKYIFAGDEVLTETLRGVVTIEGLK